jgi:4-hydroxy-4-methyl-2-oxoglutarate aldolase
MSLHTTISGFHPVRSFAQLSTAVISDALDALGVNGQCTGIHPQAPGLVKPFCGRAFTVQFMPCGTPDERTPSGGIGDYIDDVPEGYVIAIDNRERLDCCVWDSQVNQRAVARGVAGVVIDGACRMDTDANPQLPVLARGRQARHGAKRVRVEAFNLAVVIGGVRVECDDLLIADHNGLVVIPRDYIQAVWKHIQAQA